MGAAWERHAMCESALSDTKNGLVLVTNTVTVTTEKQVKSDRVRESFSKYRANIAAQNISASNWSNKNVRFPLFSS